MPKKNFFKSYAFSLLLLAAIAAGSGLGFILKEKASVLKPFGDVFLNLLFCLVVPLVFFSIASAVSGMKNARRLKKIFLVMLVVFVGTGIIASLTMIVGVKAFPPAGISMDTGFMPPADQSVGVGERLAQAVSVPDFVELLSRKSMLALIIFAVLIGLATLAAGEKGEFFKKFLFSGNEVFTKAIGYVMGYAPIGLGAYFAYLTGILGPQLLGSYAQAVGIYYPVSLLYFVAAFSFYAYLAGGVACVGMFWRNIIPTALTAFGTGSSVAAIPSNLDAAEKNGVPEDIREVVIPIGSTIHMDGSCLSAILKIAVLFSIFGMEFSGPGTILTAVAIALLSGTVMSGIPGGGFLGEMMIVSMYGFPIEALPVISLIGTLVDPPATMVNAAGDNVCSMLVARILGHRLASS